MDARFELEQEGILGLSLFIRCFSMMLAFHLRCIRLNLHEDVQSDDRAHKWSKGFANFSHSNESSAVQSELAKHGKLEPRPCSFLCKANVL